MAQFSRIEVANQMKQTGMVPLFYSNDIDVCKNVLKACYDGGARLFEFTARGDFAHHTFAELITFSKINLPEMILGVGSITDAASASLYIQLGANFIVTPVLREDIALVCNRRKILWSPGCATLTEIAKAEELGCEIIKLFPADVYGPNFVKSIKAPQPWTSIMPTGGILPTKESLTLWFDAGATCVGMGSQLISEEIVSKKEYAELSQKVKSVLGIIKSITHKI